jgi:hypothetical protein
MRSQQSPTLASDRISGLPEPFPRTVYFLPADTTTTLLF